MSDLAGVGRTQTASRGIQSPTHDSLVFLLGRRFLDWFGGILGAPIRKVFPKSLHELIFLWPANRITAQKHRILFSTSDFYASLSSGTRTLTSMKLPVHIGGWDTRRRFRG